MNPPLPTEHAEALAAAWADAARLADEGDARAGYQLLLQGLEAARHLGDGAWVAVLVERWRDATEVFAERHRVT